MNEYGSLMSSLVPQNAAFEPLWNLTIWDKRFNSVENQKQSETKRYKYLLASELSALAFEDGNVKLLTTNKSDIWTTRALAEDYVSDGEIIAIPWGGNPIVQYYKGEFVTADNRIAVVRDSQKLNTKFLYYYLLTKIDVISETYRGSGIKHPNMARILEMTVPVPPLTTQLEIVEVLDTFTGLEAELEAELEARRKQYEYYRNQLLSFLEKGGVRWVPMGDVAKCISGATPSSTESAFWADGTIPWMSSGEVNKKIIFETEKLITKEAYESCSTKMIPSGSVVIALAGQGKTRGQVARTRIELCTNQSLCSVIPNEKLSSDFLYHFLAGQYANLRAASSGDGSRGGLNLEILRNYLIPLPDLEMQREIASKLDQFEDLIGEENGLLPLEIADRRKQYEYYRDKLLTFKELKAS